MLASLKRWCRSTTAIGLWFALGFATRRRRAALANFERAEDAWWAALCSIHDWEPHSRESLDLSDDLGRARDRLDRRVAVEEWLARRVVARGSEAAR